MGPAGRHAGRGGRVVQASRLDKPVLLPARGCLRGQPALAWGGSARGFRPGRGPVLRLLCCRRRCRRVGSLHPDLRLRLCRPDAAVGVPAQLRGQFPGHFSVLLAGVVPCLPRGQGRTPRPPAAAAPPQYPGRPGLAGMLGPGGRLQRLLPRTLFHSNVPGGGHPGRPGRSRGGAARDSLRLQKVLPYGLAAAAILYGMACPVVLPPGLSKSRTAAAAMPTIPFRSRLRSRVSWPSIAPQTSRCSYSGRSRRCCCSQAVTAPAATSSCTR